MAHNNRPNAELWNQMTYSLIRRICNIAQEVNSEDGNSPLMFLKLPRHERRPVVKGKTPLSTREGTEKRVLQILCGKRQKCSTIISRYM